MVKRLPPSHFLLFGIYVLYVWWGYWLEAKPAGAENAQVGPGLSVTISYLAGVPLAVIGGWLLWLWGISMFNKGTSHESEARSGKAWLAAFFLMLGIQAGLLAWHMPTGTIVWMAAFACITAGLAMGSMWISIGYPGMWYAAKGQNDGQRWSEGIKQEMDLLRVLIQVLATFYGLTIVAVTLGLDKVDLILGQKSGTELGIHQMAWFLAGVVIILAGLHLGITAPVYNRYMKLVSLIRDES